MYLGWIPGTRSASPTAEIAWGRPYSAGAPLLGLCPSVCAVSYWEAFRCFQQEATPAAALAARRCSSGDPHPAHAVVLA
ncbi:hypothetical protein KKF61_07550, partial [Patescibacteria group bacterium]|nr:hypothetical protein [Patescibacteria group bacterium]